MVRTGFAILVTLVFHGNVSLAQKPAAPTAPAHNTFILAGCLEAPLPGTSVFRLTDAKPIGHAPPGGPAGLDERNETVPTKPAYLLQPVSGVSQSGVTAEGFKPHIGHRVEVTVRPPDVVAPAPRTDGASPATPSAPAVAAPQPFSVIAIKPGARCQ